MGKATRWLRGLLGIKKDKENMENNSSYDEKKKKKGWSFGKSGEDSRKIPSTNTPVGDSGWLKRSYIAEIDKEQNKHAIAVAAATAAAADAALAAAQAAVAVVRLTSQGRGALFDGRDRWAAIKIQTVFRGYLARKALRALKGLVKIQALVRGYLVRKHAALTLRSMQALIRAQATVRSQRARNSIHKPELQARKSIERSFDEIRSELHSKRLSSSYDPLVSGFDESPKVVEIDTCKPDSSSQKISTSMSEYGDDEYYQAIYSPLPCPYHAPRLSIPARLYHDHDYGEDYKFPSAQSTPRFMTSGRANGVATPAKSVCGDSFFSTYSHSNGGPNYMANTQSYRAKLRSHSAPKQRSHNVPKKRLPLNEIMASRTSFSGVRMQRSGYQFEEEFDF